MAAVGHNESSKPRLHSKCIGCCNPMGDNIAGLCALTKPQESSSIYPMPHFAHLHLLHRHWDHLPGA